MTQRPLRSIVVVGGGTAGWMAAAALGKVVGTGRVRITLVESEEIGTIGVGEATIPAILLFNRLLEIDEDAFVAATQATFKLGIEFVDWTRLGHRYFHNFGLLGAELRGGAAFSNYWLRWASGSGADDPLRFSAETVAARGGRFGRAGGQDGLPSINYAFQFDAAAYAAFLRDYAERRGVVRREGRVVEVERGDAGIEAIRLADGGRVAGDFFVDCSGMRGLLIGALEGTDYDDWREWLPNDRAIAVPCERGETTTPFTRATARGAGWQWRIPLQHRIGNGHVFSSPHMSDDEAAAILLGQLDGAPLAEPRTIRFTTGRRRRSWVGNCLAVGLSSGFLEPLESTSIHLVQAAIMKLLDYFPTRDSDPVLVDRFNDEMARLYEAIRDFLLAHYVVTERDDTAYWRGFRAMELPDTLREKLALFERRGEVLPKVGELFSETSWFAVLYGQGIRPVGWNPIADGLSDDQLALTMARIGEAIDRRVAGLPPHDRFVAGCCAASPPAGR
ncbi:tryptophan halogenase family protein [Sphingomonas sp. ASV193]|uniref:tryptophan halogenase family protein n=1 Tax=Sphingomonas sp. ASV193 TaxID=3144405 RepID=UPI0032E8EA1A